MSAARSSSCMNGTPVLPLLQRSHNQSSLRWIVLRDTMIYLLGEDKGHSVSHRILEVGPVSLTNDDPQTPVRIVAEQFAGFQDAVIAASSTKKRRVRFSEKTTSQPLPHFTEEERTQRWNMPEDTARIHAHNRMLVCRARRGIAIDENVDTLRGLEKQLRGNKPSRRYQESVVVVMETQDEFWDEENDAEGQELIASLYTTISRESAAEAVLTGIRDEIEAKQSMR